MVARRQLQEELLLPVAKRKVASDFEKSQQPERDLACTNEEDVSIAILSSFVHQHQTSS